MIITMCPSNEKAPKHQKSQMYGSTKRMPMKIQVATQT